MHIIQPAHLPIPKGHYSPAVVHAGLVYVSGQLPVDASGQPQLGTVEEQTALCLHNMADILHAAGSDLGHILKVQIFVSDIALWPRVNAEYARILGDHRPARVVVPCGALHYGCAVEIDCVAALAF